MPRRHRKMRKGGFLGFGESDSSTSYGSSDSGSGMFDSIGSTLSGWGSSISSSANSAWEKTKNATTGAYDSATGTTPAATTSYGMGGKRSRKMRGGMMNTLGRVPTSGPATSAAPVSGVKTAQPHNLVGGRTRRHRRSRKHHRHSKSCKHRKH